MQPTMQPTRQLTRQPTSSLPPFVALAVCALASSCSPSKLSDVSEPAPTARLEGCGLGGPTLLIPSSRQSSSVAIAHQGSETLAFVADEDTSRLIAKRLDGDVDSAELVFDLSGAPSSVLVAESGAAVVTIPERSQLQVVQYDGSGLYSRCAVPTASEPVATALSEDGRRLLLASAWGQALQSFDARRLNAEQQFRIDLDRDPRAVAIDDASERAFVSHGVGGVLSVVDLASREVERVSLHAPLPPGAKERRKQIEESFAGVIESAAKGERSQLVAIMRAQLAALERPARFGSQGFSLALSVAPKGRVFVPQTEVDPGVPEQRTAGYGNGGVAAATPAVAVIDQETLEAHELSVQPPAAWVSPQLVAGREACRLPRSAAVDEQSGLLLVACLGADTLIGYDAASPSPIDAEVLRLPVAAGPSGVAIDTRGRRAVVWSQFARTLNIVQLPEPGAPLEIHPKRPQQLALQRVPERERAARFELGRRLFHATDDARIAFDGRSCASCHIGGRDDGLTWSTPNGPRRTKMLAATLDNSAPYSWDGSEPTLHDQLESTFERLQGQGGLRSSDLDALLFYVGSLPPPPRSKDLRDDELVRRGEQLFFSKQTECSTCHTGKLGTDGARHDVASNVEVDVTARFDTPTLRFLEGRAPYFHDGRYATLRALLRGSDGQMGHTAHLAGADLDALEAYLETL